MSNTAFTLRPMQVSDISNAMRLSSAEGWNQTVNDWKLFIENPDNVCWLAESNTTVVGTTTVMNYANGVGWVGMVLVDREYRRLGISKALLTTVLKKAASCRSIKLDATPAGQKVYQQFGFKKEYFIARMVNPSLKNFVADKYDCIPEPVQSHDMGEIIALDALVFGAGRHRLIEFLIRQYPERAWLLKREHRITGFVLGREGRKYHQMGPLVSESSVDAKILFSKALEILRNQPVVVDVLYDKEDVISWLNTIGFDQQRHFIRMYKEENPFPGVIDKQYFIAGPEFG